MGEPGFSGAVFVCCSDSFVFFAYVGIENGTFYRHLMIITKSVVMISGA
jgi:hypothetical protein